MYDNIQYFWNIILFSSLYRYVSIYYPTSMKTRWWNYSCTSKMSLVNSTILHLPFKSPNITSNDVWYHCVLYLIRWEISLVALCLQIKKKLVQGLLLWVGSKYLLNMEDHRISIETIFNSNGLLIIKPQKNIAVQKDFSIS